jgi:DNA-binding XRE family transcriptional regulator
MTTTDYVSTHEASLATGVPYNTLVRRIQRGDIPAMRDDKGNYQIERAILPTITPADLRHERGVQGEGLKARLAGAREKAGFSRSEVAQALGVGYGTVYAWECGKGGIPVKRLNTLAGLYQVSVKHLLSGEDE